MGKPLICLTLTGKTLDEDLELVNKYRSFIDIVELRADFLSGDERLVARKFPKMAGIPCILTLRRKIDGGKFIEGEAARTILFARALSFADEDSSKNFAYVDFEEDFHVPSLQDAALAFGTKIIRSAHYMDRPVSNIAQKLNQLRSTGYEIPKLAFMPDSMDDVTQLFKEASRLEDDSHILIAMGPYGMPSRILSARLGNYLTYTCPLETNQNLSEIGLLDPVSLNNTYNFKNITKDSDLYGIIGWPLAATGSPFIHNSAYRRKGMNAVYFPIRSDNIEKGLMFADSLDMKGLSITHPHKEEVLNYILETDKKVDDIGASNTLVSKDGIWHAYNTDCTGFAQALLSFLEEKNLHRKKVAIIGAGGAAKAVAYAVYKLGAKKVCIFNRTASKAKDLAQKYGFNYAVLNSDSDILLRKYNDVIIQTTSIGMNATGPSSEQNDPLFFYTFSGKESLYDIIYTPEQTPVMIRASEAGCSVCNGYEMLKNQAYEQFKLFTGENYNDN